MIIKTRYRDVPAEEVLVSHPNDRLADKFPDFWKKHRGKEIEIICEPHKLEESDRDDLCGGPWYIINGTSDAVCPHLAEIGD